MVGVAGCSGIVEMNEPITSLRVWSYYVLGIGAGLLLIPNVIIGVFGIAETSEVWIRVVGLVAIALGIIYFDGARRQDIGVARASVPARVAAVVAFTALWATGGPWQLLIFAAADLAGLSWTWNALRSNGLR